MEGSKGNRRFPLVFGDAVSLGKALWSHINQKLREKWDDMALKQHARPLDDPDDAEDAEDRGDVAYAQKAVRIREELYINVPE